MVIEFDLTISNSSLSHGYESRIRVLDNNIYNNYSYTSNVKWEIKKISETLLKKLKFYIDNPETGLKKTDFNVITNNDKIDDMNNNNRDDSNNDLT